MSALLMDEHLTPDQLQYARIISTSAGGLLEVINDILDFSKVEAGRVELEAQDFALRDCVEEVLEIVAPAPASGGRAGWHGARRPGLRARRSPAIATGAPQPARQCREVHGARRGRGARPRVRRAPRRW
ncbi:MAG: hypothetical protein IPP20_10965 [Gemmatimonadetes bacterium]|nr:hypothetical protein [Gemmatimonadota bacterium]